MSESTSEGARRRLRPDDGRLVRGRRSRERIRAAARELFREKGFDGATLRAIAGRAGMGASSIYRHVQTKEELLVQELADLQEEAWTRFRRGERRAGSTRERLHAQQLLPPQWIVDDPATLLAVVERAIQAPAESRDATE